MSKTGLAVALLALALVAAPPPSRAVAQQVFEVVPEARLVESSPGAGAVLATPPPRLTLAFGGDVDEEATRVDVLGPTGQRADRRDQQVDGVHAQISLLDQGPGIYRVRWRSALADTSERMRGDFAFTIQPNLPAGAPQLSLSSLTAESGDPIAVAGSGFAPGSDVVVTVGDGNDLLGIARADGSGRIGVQARLPQSLPHGRQVIQATDSASRLATAAVFVPVGGSPVAVVRLLAETDEEEPTVVTYTVRVENRSGYALSNLQVGVRPPAGTRILLDDAGQPDHSDEARVRGGQITWSAHALPAHSVVGPFTFSVSAAGMPPRTELQATAWISYAHGSMPLFRGRADSPLTRVRLPEPES